MDYFDSFSIFFSDDKLIAGRRTYPLGEITTELLNLEKAWFEKLQSASDKFVPAAREMFASKNEKVSETPTQREYRKAYNRLKVRKNRKKISNDEWNEKVAQAQEWKVLTEQGKLSDSKLREKLARL